MPCGDPSPVRVYGDFTACPLPHGERAHSLAPRTSRFNLSNSPRARPADARNRSPTRSGAGKAGLLVPHLPRRGVRNAGRFTAPAAPGVPTRNRHTRHPVLRSTGQPLLVRANGRATSDFRLSKAARPGSRYCACVPHADGLCGLLHVPGRAATAPLSRSCELSPGHALGPSARVTGVCAPSAFKNRNPRRRPEPGIVADHRIPLPRHEHARSAPLNGAGRLR